MGLNATYVGGNVGSSVGSVVGVCEGLGVGKLRLYVGVKVVGTGDG